MRTFESRGLGGDVAAVFTDRHAAEEAVEDLCAHGADPQLRTAIAGGEDRVYELDLGEQVRRRVVLGALIGLPVGAALGALLVTLTLAGGGVAGADAIWAGGLPGLVAGLVFGGFAGLVSALWVFDDIDRWMAVNLAAGEVLVIARAHEDPVAVRTILVGHGGRPVGRIRRRSAPSRRPRQFVPRRQRQSSSV
jgi:hypothetical protein